MLNERSESGAIGAMPFSLATDHKASEQVLASVQRATGLATGGSGEMSAATVPSYDNDNPKGPSVPSYDK